LAGPGSKQSNARITSIRKVRSVLGSGTRISATGRRIRQQLWVFPVLGLIGMLIAGLWVRSNIEKTMRAQQKEQLVTLLKADVAALTVWLRSQEDDVETASEVPDIRTPADDLLELARQAGVSAAALAQAPARATLQAALEPWIDGKNVTGYALIDTTGRIVASDSESLIGQTPGGGYEEFLKPVFEGHSLVTRPFPSIARIKDEFGEENVGVPTMFAAAPLKDKDNNVVGALGLRLWPNAEFTEILNVAQMGDTGETYAFDSSGMFLSSSRFEKQLKEIGLQLNQKNSRSVLAVQVRDPGVDLTQGGRATLEVENRPLTRLAAGAVEMSKNMKPTASGKAFDKDKIQVHTETEGYRDYRGVDSIGASTWLPRYGFGVATEVDTAEANRLLGVLRAAFWTMFGLLAALALLLLSLTFFARRLEKRMREAVVAAGQLGQYSLEEKIGEGGMGSVFRGRHSMMRRPAAIKLLEPSKTTEVSVARFEREVQLTSQLNHPNTITIYDYGRTDEGVFYYAMEYLDGLSLESLVEKFCPQPDGRVIYLLQQVCGSLVEAHAQGLIHRDIKPANIMLTRRGGVCDFVKLLDFGLVKAIDAQRQRTLTAADAITGTPLYLPPESISDSEAADARSDLYSLGGVAYYLLTGHAVFESGSVMDIIRQHVEAAPVPPSQRTNQSISPDLERLILQCLAKMPSERPQSAAELAAALGKCQPVKRWTSDDASAWWLAFASPEPSDAAGTATQTIFLNRTVGYSEADKNS
jgi:hypothetical protein